MIPLTKNYADKNLDKYEREAFEAKERCTKCSHRGYLVNYEDHLAKSTVCECMARATLEHKLRKANIPDEFWPQEHDLPAGTDDFVIKVGRHDGHYGLLITGATGTGKTTVACSLLFSAIKLGRSAFRIEASEVERALSLVRSGQGWVDAWLQEGFMAEFFVLDEVWIEAAKSSVGQATRSTISYLVKNRIENHMATIVCTNLARQELTEHYGESFASIVLGNRFISVEMVGEDLRQ